MTPTPSEFAGTLALILASMAVVSAFEAMVPLFPRPPHHAGRRTANFGFTAMSFAINWVCTSVAAVLTVVQGAGILDRTPWPPAVEIGLSILALDFFFGYLAHVTLHHLPPLWKAHAVHHSDGFVDVTTTYRTHPIETVWRNLFMILPVWALGVPPFALVVYRVLSAINALLEHANIRPWAALDSALSVVWVTPNMHKIHHSRERVETNSNYGNLLSVYDRLFRTFTPTRRATLVTYGLDRTDAKAIASFRRLLRLQVYPRSSHDDEISSG